MARDVVAGLTVSTDVIVGFPGETEQDFQATLDVVAEARFDSAFMFQFSPRPGTPAAALADQVPAPVVQERFDRLVELQNRITFERNREQEGTRCEVLVEGPSKRNAAWVTARSRGNRPVHVRGDYPAGTFLDVTITRGAPHHLVGAAH
jgi:tRNA-2-methylthio-N6-dimethylallyladenosine synthase